MNSNNKISEKEIRKKISFAVATRKINYWGINLTKEVNYLYPENYRTLKKEIKEDTSKWKYTSYSWTGRINIIKMSVLPKTIHTFSEILIKIPITYLADIEPIFK